MIIRMFEYDTQIALDDGEIVKGTLTVRFPHSAILYLRHNRRTPEKKLLFLTPFYIFTHESRFREYEKDADKREVLRSEVSEIMDNEGSDICYGRKSFGI